MSAVEAAALPRVATGVGPARRVLDVTVSLIVIVLTSPLLLLAALALFVNRSRPVLYRQMRVGEAGRAFTMYKLCTMVPAARAPEFTVPDDPRITRVGRVLRATHVDELPQLLNVLRGDMTLVGPRPETLALAARYPAECRAVLAFRPGLTGPCQVLMRKRFPPPGVDAEDFYLAELVPQRAALDLRYLDAPTLAATLSLLACTVAVLLKLRPTGAPPRRRASSLQRSSRSR